MKIKKADDVSPQPVTADGAECARIRLLIHDADGAPNFYMRQFDVAVGGCSPLHTHEWEHEIYILDGSATIDSPQGEKHATAGDCIFIEPNELHRVRNTGDKQLKFLCLVPKRSG